MNSYTPRIMLFGDTGKATAWIGQAKKIGRQLYDAGVGRYMWRPTADVEVEFLNYFFVEWPLWSPNTAYKISDVVRHRDVDWINFLLGNTSEPCLGNHTWRQYYRICKIKITAGGFVEGYQFAGTDSLLYQDYPDPSVADRYYPRLRYTLVKPITVTGRPVDSEGKLIPPGGELYTHAVPLISNFDEGEKEYGKIKYKWDHVPDLDDIFTPDDGTPPAKLKLWKVNQEDGGDVTYWYGIKANPFLITTWAQDRDLLIPTTIKESMPDHGLYGKYNFYDDGYDFPPSSINTNRDPIRTQGYRVGTGVYGAVSSPNGMDWPRHGCFRDVEYTAKDGTKAKRRFLICYDVEYLFYAFPTSARLLDKPETGTESFSFYGYVDWKYTKTDGVPWPSNVKPELVGKDLDAQYRPTFHFSHDGKRAVCIARVIDEPWANGDISSKSIDPFDSTKQIDLKSWSPVMVEIEFTLEVTGDELEAFTFNVTRKRVIDPETSGRSIVLADYAVRDFPDHGVEADDLIVLEYEMYVGAFTVPTFPLYPLYKYMTGGNNPVEALAWGGYSKTEDLDFPIIGGPSIGIPVVTVNAGNHLIDPNKATIAKVKNLKTDATDGTTIIQWLAHYASRQFLRHKRKHSYEHILFANVNKTDYYDRVIDFPIPMESWFSTINTINELNPDYRRQSIFYCANIRAIELNTLSFVLAPSLRLQGCYQTFPGNYYIIQSSAQYYNLSEESISGVLQVVYAFGVEDESVRQYGGHAALETVLTEMFRLESSCPNWTLYKKLDLRGRITATEHPISTSSYSTSITYNDKTIVRNYTVVTDCYHLINDVNVYSGYQRIYGQKTSSNVVDGSGTITELPNEQDILFTRCNVQNLTINYGNTAESINRVFGCAEFYARVKNGLRVIYVDYLQTHFECYKSAYYFIANVGRGAVTIAPKVFGFFDSFHQLRPGVVHRVIDSSDTVHDQTHTVVDAVGNPGFTGFPFGKIHFQRVYELTFTPTGVSWNQFRTHPNGSWAARFYPIIFCTGKHRTVFDFFAQTMGHTGLGAVQYGQMILDKIHFVYTYRNKTTGVVEEFFKDTTHLEQLNEAFNKEHTEEDYRYEISKKNSRYTLGDRIFYSGGMSIESTWVSPLFKEKYTLLYQGEHAYFNGWDTSRPIGAGLLYEYVRSGIFSYNTTTRLDNPYLNYSYDFSEMIDTHFQMHIQSPCIESLFYFKEPYIDRKENRE